MLELRDTQMLVYQVDVLEKVGSKVGLLDTVKNLLDRACPMLIDANCIKSVVTKVPFNSSHCQSCHRSFCLG